ncbi:metal ABC transporter solute-binding protein, Zn/Mn family [Desulfobulbus alkaliphilus]|uniref:metal ABC transporter solute-binding protein, Zn/Mn family n=1 Tax=Desulfobulbus alkaliphilus TaxID=869814 RepID=UPI0019664F8F|nr:zinc ABC transporter substrate-binding protein [Desulfobulbus alkaliphilus]MBM9538621.1 zinc ABC transporter substrate-binding protein [Desulfobulbus alkaliphilus]
MFILVITACSDGNGGLEQADFSQRSIRVVTTTAQIADAVENIGGRHVAVTSLMGPGSDPHLYVASESDVSRLSEADIIFYNGLDLEARMNRVLRQLGRQKPVIAVGETLAHVQLLKGEEKDEEHDPHIWFDVQLWMQVVETVRDTLIEVDPDRAVVYQANAEAYLAELADLHTYVLAQAHRLPAEQRVLITAHDAFGYFGQAYGFAVYGLQGVSTDAEAGTADVRRLADFIAENQIRAIFIESSVPVRNVEALQAAVASRGFQVDIGGELFSDAMGQPGTPEGTYIGMVRHNIDTIVNALLGE